MHHHPAARSALAAPAIVAIAATLAACGGESGSPPDSPAPGAATTGGDPGPDPPAREPLAPPPCPPELANCERATGTIAYVERVDPDGDGDAHFVLVSEQSITAPGITILDVRRELRPRPLPGPGDEIAGAGPVFPGSQGQLQIEAVALRLAR